MISERHLARGFESVWQSLFPMLTPGFMRTFNEHFVKDIGASGAGAAGPVPVDSDAPDLVAELGIALAGRAVGARLPVERIAGDRTALREAWKRVQALLGRYEGQAPEVAYAPLAAGDTREGTALARNLVAFAGLVDGSARFSPGIPGAGVVARCEADLAVGDTLVEIKTVSRGFRSNDLRQLLVYLALDWIRGPRWQKGCLVNPRRAVWADFEVDWLVRRLSGRPAADTFGDFADAFGSGIELETTDF